MDDILEEDVEDIEHDVLQDSGQKKIQKHTTQHYLMMDMQKEKEGNQIENSKKSSKIN